jgi:hypothetical protein
MADMHKSLRLGDLLVEKGLITRLQLREAIEVQQTLQSQLFSKKSVKAKTELGEILIELGYISRHQLQVNLNWQRRLKATTAVMVFIAPLLTAACGGGGGGSASAAQNAGQANFPSSLVPSTQSPKPDSSTGASPSHESPTTQSSSSAPSASPINVPPIGGASTISSSSSNAQGAPAIGVSSSSSLPNAVSSSSSPTSSSSSSSSSSEVDGSVQLLWTVPTQRENGDFLDITEIGGYELRYKLKGETEYKHIHITDGFTDAYYFGYLKGEYEFQIATFDKDGLYSNFVDINPS